MDVGEKIRVLLWKFFSLVSPKNSFSHSDLFSQIYFSASQVVKIDEIRVGIVYHRLGLVLYEMLYLYSF